MAGTRLAGLASNMDTDSIVANMMKAQRAKQDKVKANKTKLEWQQDKWKELQTKLYKLYTDFSSPMSKKDAYNTKKVSSSNNDKVSVSLPPGSTNLPEGSHRIEVKKVASSQYVTGGQLSTDKNKNKITSSTKLTDLTNIQEGAIFTIKNAEKEINFQVRADSTIGEYVYALNQAGMVASFDESRGRLFISSKNSGTKNAFEISSNQMSSGQVTTRKDLDNYLNYGGLNSDKRAIIDKAYMTLKSDSTASATEKEEAKKSLQSIAKENAEANYRIQVTNDVKTAYMAEFSSTGSMSAEYEKIKKEVEDSASNTATPADIEKAIKERIEAEADKYIATDDVKRQINDTYDNGIATVLDNTKIDMEALMNNFENATGGSGAVPDALLALGLEATKGASSGSSAIMTVVAAEDAEIIYNGLTMIESSNSFAVNGMIIEAKEETTSPVSITVTKDSQEVYDKIKNFIGSYNDILKEMNDLYYATSSRGYEPLTDEEQEAMTDKQIEKWEQKIKDSILRRDDTLGNLTTNLKNAMMSSVEVNGHKYSLSNFGIATSDLDYSEKGILHIFGDKEDATYAAKNDQLMAALQDDPDLVMEVFSGIFSNVNKYMMAQMKGTTIRSALKFYDDKAITEKLRNYEKEIKTWDKKLSTLETKYYKQFSDMELALSKLNSQQNSLAGMLG